MKMQAFTYTDGIDQDCDGYAEVGYADCDAQLLVNFSGVDTDGDGVSDSSEEISFDFCQKWSMTNTYEYDPDNRPELNSIVLALNATDNEDFQCQPPYRTNRSLWYRILQNGS